MTRLILIRHGETEYNLQKRYSGICDVELTETGRHQAELLKTRLADERIDACYSSDRKRALQTAAIAFGARPVVALPRLREIHFGVFEGLNHRQLMEQYPREYTLWLQDPYAAAIPAGERLQDFQARVSEALDELLSAHPEQTVAVVAHGGVISVYVNHLLDRRAFWEFIPKGTSITVVQFEGGSSRVVVFNDHAHLGS